MPRTKRKKEKPIPPLKKTRKNFPPILQEELIVQTQVNTATITPANKNRKRKAPILPVKKAHTAERISDQPNQLTANERRSVTSPVCLMTVNPMVHSLKQHSNPEVVTEIKDTNCTVNSEDAEVSHVDNESTENCHNEDGASNNLDEQNTATTEENYARPVHDQSLNFSMNDNIAYTGSAITTGSEEQNETLPQSPHSTVCDVSDLNHSYDQPWIVYVQEKDYN